MKILLKNIKELAQVREPGINIIKGHTLKDVPVIENAFLAIEDGLIVAFGSMNDWEGISDWRGLEIIDCSGKSVLPAWCDSHTHLVFAGSREGEFVDRINGLSYEEVALRGGGILNSAKKLQCASEENLLKSALGRLDEIAKSGTGAVEIKSGYGLSMDSELKMLQVIQKLKDLSPLSIKATFMGAHAIPAIFAHNREGYIDILINEMIPRVGEEKLADFCDVFCEKNYFSEKETIKILEAGKKYGLIPKVHANQLSFSGGIEAGVAVGAISVDHLEYVGTEQIQLLLNSNTIATILPGAQFFLGLPTPPVREMADAGLTIAIASDYNPGSCPSGNMNQMMSLACILYKLTPKEALNAVTVNGAAAMDLSNTLGSITIGKKANVIITKEIPSLAFIPYSFGSSTIETIILNGEIISTQN